MNDVEPAAAALPAAPARAQENAPPVPRRLVIVGCGAAKLNVPAPAGQMYIGSFHRLCRQVAEVVARPDGQVMILSAEHGLLDLQQRIEPYDRRMGDASAVTAEVVACQADRLGLRTAEVTVLAGRAYAEAVQAVWPNARTPLAGCRGIGEMQARLVQLRQRFRPT
ncbi:hypothetical protein GCM10029978_067340 [Actinoallomurus acanthiterrae]